MHKLKKHIKQIGIAGVVIILIVLLFLQRCNRPVPTGSAPAPSFNVPEEKTEMPLPAGKTDTIIRHIRKELVRIDTIVINEQLVVFDTVIVYKERVDTVIRWIQPSQNEPVETAQPLSKAEVTTKNQTEQATREHQKMQDSLLKLQATRIEKESVLSAKDAAQSKLITPNKKQSFALKLNLLSLPLSIANVEIEVPINQRFSVATEFIGTWWWNADQYKGLHLAGGALETRYWFQQQTRHQKLIGFFVGANAGGGIYDILWNSKGYKGNYFTAGLTSGFVHSIASNLTLEYSIGLGMMHSSYEYFTSTVPNQYPWVYDASYNYLGLTRARIALSWYF